MKTAGDDFEAWLAGCVAVFMRTLRCSSTMARRWIDGAGVATIYRPKFERGLTPQQCVDDELATVEW